MQVSVQFEGGRQLEARLSALETKLSKKVVKKAVRQSIKICKAAAQRNCRTIVGGKMGNRLTRNIIVRKQKKRLPRGSYADVVRFKSSSEGLDEKLIHTTKAGKKHFIPSAIEFGHGPNKSKAARPYMRPAFLATKAKMMMNLKTMLWRGIIQLARAK